MTRRRKNTQAEPTVPLPTKLEEWNGFKHGEVVRVKGGPRSSVFWFQYHVTSSTGHVYVDVVEQQSAGHRRQGPRLIRSFAPGLIEKQYVPKRRPPRTMKEAAAAAAQAKIA